MHMKHAFMVSALLAVGAVALGGPAAPRHGVVMEIWENLKGGRVADMLETANTRPAQAVYIRDRIDEYAFGMDAFGARFTALLTPPATGEYTLYIAADDNAEVLLSTDSTAARLQKVCATPSYMKRHAFVQGPSAGNVTLKKGKKYYLVVNFKDAMYGEHVALAWEGPGIEKQIIDSKYFTPVLTPEQQQMWEKSAAIENRCKELEKVMRETPKEALAAWLDSLSHDDRNILCVRLQKVVSEVEDMTPEEKQKHLKPYVDIAAGIVATPESPVKNPVAKKLLRLEELWLRSLSDAQLVALGPHRLADSLGRIAPGAQVTTATLALNSAADKWRDEMVSIGYYAAPGKEVKVTIPVGYVDKKLEVQVGHHFPDKDWDFVCMPDTTRWYKLDKETTSFVTPHGGLMLLKVPVGVGMKDTPVTIDGALKAPRFELGRNTDKEWRKLRQAPAPWGELVSEHVILLVRSDALRELKNPTAVMTWWNTNTRDHEDFYAYYPKVAFRMHAGHYAEEGAAWWPLQWAPQNIAYLLNLEAMRKKNSPLFLHEHGHHADFWEMELSRWSESTPNWAGFYMKARKGKHFDWKDTPDQMMRYLFDPKHEGCQGLTRENWYKDSPHGIYGLSMPITAMMTGYAEDFGWKCIKATLKRIRDTKGEMYQWPFVQGADENQAKVDRYLIGLSEAAKRDVRPYFAHFKMIPSAGATEYLDNLKLPRWDLTYWLQPGVTTTKPGVPLAIPCGKETLLSYAGKSRIKWSPTTASGGTVVSKGGKAVYTPAPGFKGTDVLKYQLSNEYGKTSRKVLKITVK